jgi:hypothetical protein
MLAFFVVVTGPVGKLGIPALVPIAYKHVTPLRALADGQIGRVKLYSTATSTRSLGGLGQRT